MTIKYFESHGLGITPVCEGSSPVGFQVVNISNNEVVDEFKMLHEAENFIVGSKRSPRGINVGSAAEFKIY